MCKIKTCYIDFFNVKQLSSTALYFSDPVKFCRARIRISAIAKYYFHI